MSSYLEEKMMEIAKTGWTPNREKMRWLMEHWKYNSPKMYKELSEAKELKMRAKACLFNEAQEAKMLVEGGMNWADAARIAQAENLMLEPEEEEEEELDEDEMMYRRIAEYIRIPI